jgi:hypothetical protein
MYSAILMKMETAGYSKMLLPVYQLHSITCWMTVIIFSALLYIVAPQLFLLRSLETSWTGHFWCVHIADFFNKHASYVSLHDLSHAPLISCPTQLFSGQNFTWKRIILKLKLVM